MDKFRICAAMPIVMKNEELSNRIKESLSKHIHT
jgi:hypothetical protein